ncbi:hypothetical protein KGA66_10740 [Actinocrinis puniceicyclus]|uniref:Uncharacterized protein n=1 Tax=Actinocrinis puniceicyclus TaxID=977794 RepID=A0A8J7WQ76_9ACTN|nr:hypothetical protein [Actinocrinis puniceicyclus]MBS2963525.1 hypothetical protein [Actinocrinis puniceicyclus]
MQARLTFILDRLNADLSGVGLGSVSVVDDPGAGWGEGLTVFEFQGRQTSANPREVEAAVALLASTFQDDVIDERHGAWPEVNGKPLWASADSGVACWYLDGKPWCAVGQLAGALAVNAPDSAE